MISDTRECDGRRSLDQAQTSRVSWTCSDDDGAAQIISDDLILQILKISSFSAANGTIPEDLYSRSSALEKSGKMRDQVFGRLLVF